MPSDRKPSLILPVAAVAVLLTAYVGVYYWLVRIVTVPNGIKIPRYVREYSGPQTAAGWRAWSRTQVIRHHIFRPMHWLDRRIRPHVWEPEAETFLPTSDLSKVVSHPILQERRR